MRYYTRANNDTKEIEVNMEINPLQNLIEDLKTRASSLRGYL
jgi:hypothetical protein